MENFEFKSAVCTSAEQSKRLLELGLKRETADMSWFRTNTNDDFECCTSSYTEWAEEILPIVDDYILKNIIPAWSLHRLMEIVMKGDKLGCITHNIHQNNVSTYYELVITSIEHLIKIDKFNKDYLEEK